MKRTDVRKLKKTTDEMRLRGKMKNKKEWRSLADDTRSFSNP